MNRKRVLSVLAMVLLTLGGKALWADTSFDCTGIQSQFTLFLQIPSGRYSFELDFSIDPASAASSATFTLDHPGGSESLDPASGDPDFSVGITDAELEGNLSDAGPGNYTLEVYQKPSSMPLGELASGTWALRINGLSGTCRIWSTRLRAVRTTATVDNPADLIAFNPCSAPTVQLTPTTTSYTLNAGIALGTITVTTNDADNSPAGLIFSITPTADAANPHQEPDLSTSDVAGQTEGTFNFTPSGVDYDTVLSEGDFQVTFTASDKDNPSVSNDATITINVVNAAPVLTLNHDNGQQSCTGTDCVIGVGELIRVDVFATDVNGLAIFDLPEVDATPALAETPTWDAVTHRFTYTPIAADQGKSFDVTFVAKDKDNPATLEDTETVYFMVGSLPAALDVNPTSMTDFSIRVGSHQDKTVALTNQSTTAIAVTLATADGAIVGIDYEHGDNGYFAASFDTDLYHPDTDTSVSLGSDATLTVRYVALKPGPAPNQSLTLDHTDGPTTINLGGQSEEPSDRNHFSNIAVLDKSGSMRRDSETPGKPKIDALKDNLRMFYDFVDALAGISDKIGLIRYNQGAEFPENIDLDSHDVNGTQVEGFITGLEASGSTSISRALKKAIQQMADEGDLAASDRHHTILLMTDGRHNTPSLDFNENFSRDEADYPLVDPNDADDIKLHVVGYGQSGDLQGLFLEQLCTENFGSADEYQFLTGGRYRHTRDDKKLGVFFVQILLDDYFNAEVSVDDEGEVQLGGQSEENLYITRSTEKAVFYLTWSDPSIRLYFRLLGSGDEKIPDICTTKEAHAIGTLDFPYQVGQHSLQPQGEWKMHIFAIPTDEWEAATDNEGNTDIEAAIRGSMGDAESPEAGTILYEAALVTKDPQIHAEFDILGSQHYTGDEILLTAKLHEAGAPVLHADDVTVSVSVPAEALGDFLYNNRVSADQIAGAITDGDTGDSAATEKLAALLEEKDLNTYSIVFPMNDEGRDGDQLANDGVYTARIHDSGSANPTENNGVYTYKFKAGGLTGLGDRFYRSKTFSGYIASIPDADQSQASYYYVNSTTAKVSMSLNDRFGHKPAPILGRTYTVVALDPSRCNFQVVEAKDMLNGEWVFTLNSPSGDFEPFMETDELIGLDIGGLGMPEVSLPTTIARPNLRFELFGGWSSYFNTIPIDDSFLAGARLQYHLGLFFSPGVEIAYAKTKDNLDAEGHVLNYGVNFGFHLPWILFQMQPFINVGGGRAEFLDFTNPDSAWTANFGAGMRYGFGWRRRTGLTFEIKDTLLFDVYGKNIANNLQLLLGLYW